MGLVAEDRDALGAERAERLRVPAGRARPRTGLLVGEEDRAVEADAARGEERRAPAAEGRRRVVRGGGGPHEGAVLIDAVEGPAAGEHSARAVEQQLVGEGAALRGPADARLR